MSRSPLSLASVTGICLWLAASYVPLAVAAPPSGIEKPVPGKEYLLTKERGPWMIMLTTFHTTGDKGQTEEGKTPDQAADDLIFELRELGFPAYKFIHEPGQELIQTTDSQGREEQRKNLRRIRTVCVVGGNYSSIDDPVAQQSLAWVKKLYPKSLREGVLFVPSKGRPGPLSGAFLTMNPLRSPNERQRLVADELQLKLNLGENYSLLENKGEYTLLVARFYGKSATVDQSKEAEASRAFVENLSKNIELENAGIAARELTAVLRGRHDPTNTFNNIDAYIWHDHYESFVTVGSFNSTDDPRIQQYVAKFGPQQVPINGIPTAQPAHFGTGGFGKNRNEIRIWIFEAQPALIQVPRAR